MTWDRCSKKDYEETKAGMGEGVLAPSEQPMIAPVTNLVSLLILTEVCAVDWMVLTSHPVWVRGIHRERTKQGTARLSVFLEVTQPLQV